MSDLHEAFENAKRKELEENESAHRVMPGIKTSTCIICHKKHDECKCMPNWSETESSGV